MGHILIVKTIVGTSVGIEWTVLAVTISQLLLATVEVLQVKAMIYQDLMMFSRIMKASRISVRTYRTMLYLKTEQVALPETPQIFFVRRFHKQYYFGMRDKIFNMCISFPNPVRQTPCSSK